MTKLTESIQSFVLTAATVMLAALFFSLGALAFTVAILSTVVSAAFSERWIALTSVVCVAIASALLIL